MQDMLTKEELARLREKAVARAGDIISHEELFSSLDQDVEFYYVLMRAGRTLQLHKFELSFQRDDFVYKFLLDNQNRRDFNEVLSIFNGNHMKYLNNVEVIDHE